MASILFVQKAETAKLPVMLQAWRVVRLASVALMGVGLLLAGACGGRTTPIICGDATQSPKSIFGDALEVPTPAGAYKLFQNGQEFGCMGLRWTSQTGDPPNFIVKFTQDGKYLVRDASGNFSDASVTTSVPAGVDKFDVYFFVSKESPDTIDCRSYLQRGLDGCIARSGSNAQCVFAWRLKDVAMSGDNGVCRLCYREQCNGKDDDCNDDGTGVGVDDAGTCGSILGQSCKYVATVDSSTPGCDANTKDIKCLLDQTNTAYVCIGTVAEPTTLQWRKIPDVAPGCTDANDGKTLMVGAKEMLCDTCDGKRTFRLKEGAGSRCATTAILSYVPPN